MKSPPLATSPTSTSSFPWKLGRLCSLRASCARIPAACGTFSDVAVLATFIACVVLDARGEAAAFWACHLTHAISASITLPTNCVGGSQHRPNSRDLSLHHHRRIDNNLVDVLSLRELGRLGHLVDQDFHCLQRSLNTRDLSLHHHKRVDNFVDALALRGPGLLGHLVDRDFQCLRNRHSFIFSCLLVLSRLLSTLSLSLSLCISLSVPIPVCVRFSFTTRPLQPSTLNFSHLQSPPTCPRPLPGQHKKPVAEDTSLLFACPTSHGPLPGLE